MVSKSNETKEIRTLFSRIARISILVHQARSSTTLAQWAAEQVTHTSPIPIWLVTRWEAGLCVMKVTRWEGGSCVMKVTRWEGGSCVMKVTRWEAGSCVIKVTRWEAGSCVMKVTRWEAGSCVILIQKTSEVLSLLRPIVHDTSKTAKITWFILVLHWTTDVI